MEKFAKRIVLTIALLIPVLLATAQDKHFGLHLNYGYSLPMGQFASHEFKRDSVEYGAYALVGSTFSGGGDWYFYKNLGIGLQFSLSYFPIADGYYLEDKDAYDPSATNFRLIKSTPYQVRNYMAGLLYRMPLYKKFSVSFKGMGGTSWVQTPDQFYSANYFGIGQYYWAKTSAISSTFSFLLGTVLKYQVFDHVVLSLGAEYSYTKSYFHFWDASYTIRRTQVLEIPLFSLQPGLTITF